MAQIIEGDRIGATAPLKVGCVAAIFDASGERVLLTRRSDNGQWCLPGGGMESGESVAEACEREILEETGLRGKVRRLIGVYSSPHRITAYADGNRFQFVSFLFEVKTASGEIELDHESTEYGYFTESEIETIDLIANQRERISDIFLDRTSGPVIK